MSDDLKTKVQRVFEEVFNQGKVEVADEIIAPNSVDHEAGAATGPESAKQAAVMFRAAFPDLKMTMDDAITEGNQIAVRFTLTGTHQGEFMGIPASGKPVKISGVDIVRFEDGMAVEHWGYMDQMALMQQIGAMPSE